MNEDLLRRINEALDTPKGVEGDAELQRTFADDPEAAAVGEEMVRVEQALRRWPEAERSDEAWEALAVRVGQRLDEDLMPMDDPTEPPELEAEPGEEPRQAASGQFSLRNLANLRTLDEEEEDEELLPLQRPPPAAQLPKRTDERFSLSDVVSQMGPTRAGPPLEFLSAPPPAPSEAPPAPRPVRGGALLWGGLAAAAVLGLAVVGGVTFMGGDAAEAPLAAAPDTVAQGRMEAEAPMESEPAGVASRGAGAVGEAAPEPAAIEEAAADEVSEGAADPAEEPESAEIAAEPAPSPMRRARTVAGSTPRTSARPGMRSPATQTTMAARPPSMAGGGGLPDTPSREDVQGALRAVAPAVAACGGGARRGIATVQITVGSSGRVRNAVVTGPFAGTPEGSCIARTARRARFPAFRQATFRVTYPFRL